MQKNIFILFLCFFCFGIIHCPKPINKVEMTSFGIKQNEIPEKYAKFFFDPSKPRDIGWRIGAFLLDKIIQEIYQKYSIIFKKGQNAKEGESSKGKKEGGTKGKAKGKSVRKSVKGMEKMEQKEEEMKMLEHSVEFEQFEMKYMEYRKKVLEESKRKGEIFELEKLNRIFEEIFLDPFFDKSILAYDVGIEWKKLEEIGEEKEMIGKNIELLVKRLNFNELAKLILNPNSVEKNKLHEKLQQFGQENIKKLEPGEFEKIEEEKREKFEYMKMKMREITGPDDVYKTFEMMRPILFRIDIIEPMEFFRIFHQSLLIPNGEERNLINRVQLATIFGEIWKMRTKISGLRVKLELDWKDSIQNGKGKFEERIDEFMRKLIVRWIELNGQDKEEKMEPAEFRRKVMEYNKKSLKLNRKQIGRVFREVEEFRDFLDKNVGTRARLLNIFYCEPEIGEIFIEEDGNGNELRPLLEMNPNDKEMLDLFNANYLDAFTSKNTKIEGQKAMMKIWILLGVHFLDGKFGQEENENLRNQWTKLRPIFFLFIDQLVDYDEKFWNEEGIIYRNMLYKLRKFIMSNEGRENANLREILEEDLGMFKNKSTGKIYLVNLEQQIEILEMENVKMIKMLGENEKYAKLGELAEGDGSNLFQTFIEREKGKEMVPTEEKQTSATIDEYISWNSNFLEPYKNYLEGNDEYKTEVQLDATLWHYKKLLDKLFSHNEIEMFAFRDYKFHWEIMHELGSIYSMKEKYRRLCLTKVFIQNFLYTNEQGFQLFPEWDHIKKLIFMNGLNDHICDNENELLQYYGRLIIQIMTVETRMEIYIDYLNWLITNFNELQTFLLQTNSNFKDQIIKMISVDENAMRLDLLDTLEKIHPKLLRIHEMHAEMRWQYIKIILGKKSHTQESRYSHARVDISLLIGLLEWIGMASRERGLGKENENLFEMIRTKSKNILNEVYMERGRHFVSAKNICYMTRFLQMINLQTTKSDEGGSSSTVEYLDIIGINVPEKMILEHSSDLCENENEKRNAQWHRIRMLQSIHYHFIMTKNYNEIMELTKQFGGLNRQKWFMPELTESKIHPKKDFLMDSLLREHLKEAIFSENDENRVANRMAVDMFSWARLIEKELGDWIRAAAKGEKTEPKIFIQVWRSDEIQQKLIWIYDRFGNLEWKYLVENKGTILRMQSGILDLLKEAKERKMEMEEIQKEMDEIIDDKCEKINNKWKNNKIEEWNRMIYLTQKLNREQFFEQLNSNVKIIEERIGREEFKKEFKQKLNVENEKIKTNLFALIGVENDVLKQIEEKLSEKIPKIAGNKGENAGKSEEKIGKEEKQKKKVEYAENETKSKLIDEEKKGLEESTEIVIQRNDQSSAGSGDRIDATASRGQLRILAQGPTFVQSSISHNLGRSPSYIQQHSFGENSSEGSSSASNQNTSSAPIQEEMNLEEKQPTNINVEEEYTNLDMKKAIEINKKERNKKKVLQEEILTPEMIAKRKANQKARQIRKERKARKKAARKENWRIIVREKAKANKITLQEEMKQINEHLIIEEMVKLLKSKGYGEFPNADVNEENEKRRMASRKKYLNQSEFIILEMMEILAKWNKESRMLISGSMELKLNTADSDIDFIVILPYEPNKNWANEFEINFMGNSKSKCSGKKCENGDENSLYCFLCQAEKVISLQKIDSHIPQIKMRSTRNIQIDINMAIVPKELISNFPTIYQQLKNLAKYKKMKEKMEEIMKNQPNLAQIDELIRNIIIGIGKEIKEKIKRKNEMGERIENLKEIEKDLKNVIGSEEIVGANELLQNKNDKRDGMILALSGYRANKQIVDLLPKKENYRNFQIAILALKLWTKNNFIYNGLFGFLNGATLSVLVCKLAMELGENASALKLLEQFFQKYHKRGNEMLEEIHLEFKKNDENIRKILDWSKGREIAARHGNELGWQVITAGFPTQNAAFQIIPPTRRIINAELANGLEKVAKIRELIEMAGEPPANLIQEKLANLFATQKFEDKYSNFVGIICKYPPKSANGPAFCGFLEAKLRLKLPLIDAPQIDYCHIKPERIINKRICPEQFGRKNEQKLCTIWLAGIKLKDDINVENVELEAAINWKESSKQLITKTKEEFYKQLSEEDGKNGKEEDKFDAIFSYFSKEDLLKWMPKTNN